MSAGPRGYDSILSAPGGVRAGSFKSVDELEGRGLRVFLRADPYLVQGIAASSVAAPAAAAISSEGTASPEAALSSEIALSSELAASPETAVLPEATPPPAAASAPGPSTLRRLLERGARVIVGTQLSREFELETQVGSVEELAELLGQHLGVEVLLPDETLGDAVAKVTRELREGQICILPDLSRIADDVSNSDAFARRLASYVDAYVGDAFSVSHLRHASLVRLPRLVAQRALGFELQRELLLLSELGRAERAPLCMLVGGRRFSEKAELLNQWLPRAATVIVGGGVASTLLAAQGYAVGQSEIEPERLAEARSFIERARALDVELVLPTDLRARSGSGARAWVPGSLVSAERDVIVRPGQIPDDVAIHDLGPESLSRARSLLGRAKSLLWWGPLGRAGDSGYAESSLALAEAASRPALLSVVIGADLRRSLQSLEPSVRGGIDLVSTGTEAAKVLLMGRRLSAVEVLREP